ncbi:MAG: phage portal protein [Brooklawnia sp.]
MIKALNNKLDSSRPELARLDRYWTGTQPAAYLAPESRKALSGRLRMLAVNYPRLIVEALAERLEVAGFRVDDEPQAELWAEWQRLGMTELAQQAHYDALIYGRSFAVVWADSRGRPLVTIETPQQVAVLRDPATRQVTAALKRWTDGSKGHAILYLPDRITRLSTLANVTDPAAIPSTGWHATETLGNPLGRVPVVPIVNRGRLMEADGHSEMHDVLDLADALNKLMADLLVTSEFYARPRRWATGLEIMEDADGQPVKPFSAALDDIWQSEDPDTKFGQFDAARLDGYTDAAALITQQIGALTGLPPHYLGLHGDQPASADAIRSSEASLVARCTALQRAFGRAWAEVATMMLDIMRGTDTDGRVETIWASAETRTPAQQADAAAKLVAIGLPLEVALTDVMGYSPADIERVRTARRGAALDTAGLNLRELEL